MRIVRRGVRVLAVLALVGSAGLATTLPASGQEADEATSEETTAAPIEASLIQYGWWNKAQQAPGDGTAVGNGSPVPAPSCPSGAPSTPACPSGAPADGIYLAYDYQAVVPDSATAPIGNLTPTTTPVRAPAPLGPTAYGAVRFSVPEGAEGLLTLQILSRQTSTPGGVDPGAGPVMACAATSPWDGIQNGRYDQAPTYDCSSGATGQLNGDQLVLELPSGLVSESLTYDVVLLPTGAATPQPFAMSLEHPTDTSLVITNAADLAPADDFATDEDFSTFEDPLTTFDEEFSSEDFTEFSGDFSGDTFAATGLQRAAGPTAGRQVAVPAANIANPFRADASRGERMLAVLVLFAIGGALWWVGGQQTRAPRLLGSLGGGQALQLAGAVQQGGLGRFSRPRGTAHPPRL